jgi:TetR/AcrR family transcriptional regulator, transcriptional repressor for nem operon
MRYAKDHKAETRARVVEAAARALRRDGIDGTGVAALMGEAGLTKGGFYAHFASKDALVAEALTEAGRATTGSLREAVMTLNDDDRLAFLARRYLRPEHAGARGAGCTIGSLLSDLTRGSDLVRGAAEASADDLIDLVEACLPSVPPLHRRGRAQAIVGLLSGCLQLARLQPDEAARDAVLEAGQQAAIALGADA